MRTFLTTLTAALALASPAAAASPDIVVSQVYGGGGNSGATLRNDFIELFNRGTAAVDVSGWSVQYASSAGTTWQVTPLTGTIEPGQYYLVREAAGTGGTQDLPAPDASGSIAMSATAGKVALVTAATPLACGATCAAAPGVRDFVGYGGANDFEGAPAPGLSNTTADARAANGCQDTDSNAADFAAAAPQPRNTATQRASCAGDAAPVVASTSPNGGATQVPLGANVSITFSEPVALADDAVAITCSQSGAHAATRSGGLETFSFDLAQDFVRNERCTVTVSAAGVSDQDSNDPPDGLASDFSFSFNTLGLPLRIREIQGAHHLSPHDGDFVADVPGVITAKGTDGFWVQDPQPDRDERTSEGVFVFTGLGSNPDVPVGASVRVNGRVDEFRPGSANGNNLTITEIVSPTWTTGAPGSVQPTVVGIGGRLAPGFVIDNDAVGGTAEDPATPFDPRQDGLDFHESLEGMLVRVNNPLAVGPTNGFGELPVVADFGLLAFPHTLRGGVFVHPGDFNPERIILDAEAGFPTPSANVRDRLGSVQAVVHYSFGNFKYNLTGATSLKSGGLKREVTEAPRRDELAVASMNVENLDPGDPPEKFGQLAEILVDNLRSPDILAIEEVQDNDGAEDSGSTAADETYATFIEAIEDAGGPTYDFRQIDPADGEDGGEPGGNIRVGFLFRTDRGLEFVDRPGGDATTPTTVVDTPEGAQLSLSPGRLDPQNAAFDNSRKPLAGEFRWMGRTVFAVANHFNSKGGDDPLFGRFQPPNRITETQRHQQAAVVAGFVEDVLAADRNANVVVLGDLNDFEFSETLEILEDGGLFNLMETLPPWERYSYVFDGNSQTLDQILVTKALTSSRPEYDSVHVNAEFHDQASDHDPQVARLKPR
jgi:predicted extracellular nuclease